MKSTVLASKAVGIVRSHLEGFKGWKRWTLSNHVLHFPANPSVPGRRLLVVLFNEAYSPFPVINVVYSIDWALELAGFSKISTHPMVASMACASQRILGRPKVKKDPVNFQMPKALVESKITEVFFPFGS